MQQTGNLPAVPTSDGGQGRPGVDAELVGGWQQLNKANGLVPYLDYSTPTFYDTVTSALQS